MKKQITTITLGILMIVSAMAIYGGESISFETNLTNPVYTITGNQSSLEGLEIVFENSNITISPSINYKPDNFTIIFFDNITKIITKTVTNTVYRGGGGSVRYVDNNVTTYVPKYIPINTTKEVEVEKIIDNTTVIKTGYEWWHIILGLLVGVVFGWFITRKPQEEKDDIT